MEVALHHQFAEIEGSHWWFQGRRRVVAAVLRSHLGSRERHPRRQILDIGCGTGEMLDMLREFGSVRGFDTSPDAVEACHERFGDEVDVRLGSIPDELATAGPADVVTAFDVIEHLDDDAGALDHLYRLLPPGGTLVVTVPAHPCLWGPHDVISHHRRRYTRRRLRSRLEEAGFRVDFLSYFNTWLFPVIAAVRLLRLLRRPRRTREPQGRSDFSMPPRPVNGLLRGLLASEGMWLRAARLPVGVSLLALCTKPGGTAPAPLADEGPSVRSLARAGGALAALAVVGGVVGYALAPSPATGPATTLPTVGDRAAGPLVVTGLRDDFPGPADPSSLGRVPGGPAWKAVNGTWGVSAHQAYVSKAGPGRELAVVDAGGSGVQVRLARVVQGAGVVFAYRDRTDYWYVAAVPAYASWAVVKVSGGHPDQVATTGLSPVRDGTTVSVPVHDQSAEVALDGVVRVGVSDPSLGGAAQVGMEVPAAGTARARFADFSVGGAGRSGSAGSGS